MSCPTRTRQRHKRQGWLGGDKIAVLFTEKAGKKTEYGVTASESGALSTQITIPADAAVGRATITAKSNITGVKLSRKDPDQLTADAE